MTRRQFRIRLDAASADFASERLPIARYKSPRAASLISASRGAVYFHSRSIPNSVICDGTTGEIERDLLDLGPVDFAGPVALPIQVEHWIDLEAEKSAHARRIIGDRFSLARCPRRVSIVIMCQLIKRDTYRLADPGRGGENPTSKSFKFRRIHLDHPLYLLCFHVRINKRSLDKRVIA